LENYKENVYNFNAEHEAQFGVWTYSGPKLPFSEAIVLTTYLGQ